MTWTGTILTDSNFIFLGVDGYFADGVILGTQTPILDPRNPPSATQVTFLHPDFQGKITFNGTGLTVGTAPVQGGGTVPVFTGGTITSFDVEFNAGRHAVWQTGINGFPSAADFFAALQSFEARRFLEPVGTVQTGAMSAVDLGNAVAQSFGTGNFNALQAFLDATPMAFVGTGADNGLNGEGGNDTLEGRGGTDRIEGKGGNDSIDGGSGNDGFLIGGAGDDTVRGGGGDDGNIFGDNVDGSGNGDDLLDGGGGNDSLNGGGGRDTLLGGTGDDGLDGGNANDTLDGGAGADGLVGGAGNADVASYQSSTTGLTIDLFNLPQAANYASTGDAFGDTYFGVERVLGSQFADTIFGTNGPSVLSDLNWLDGGDGDDSIFGFAGEETLVGGRGNDLLVGGTQNFAGPLEVDTAMYTASLAEVILAPRDATSFFVITPFEGVDVLAEIEQLSLAGVDHPLGTLFFDARPVTIGPSNNNTLNLNAAGDIYIGAGGKDDINGLGGDDVLLGFAGADTLNGGAGDDSIAGHTGNDRLLGGSGNDTADGQEGNDVIRVNGGNDLARGGDGQDDLSGAGGRDILLGEAGRDTLNGGGSADVVDGGADDDVLRGGGGNDTLSGGTGNDTLIGGGGSDRFVFANGFGSDRITDFDATDNQEKIDLSAVTSITSFNDLSNNHMTQSGSDVRIDAGGGNEILLKNVSLGDLNGADFVF